jgi:ribosome-dependent ATPase
MNEAARCDRVALMDSGAVLACDAPAGIVRSKRVANLEDAFIAHLEEAHPERKPAAFAALEPAAERAIPASGYSLRRLWAYAIRESLELMRDPIRLGFSLFGATLLMLVFGFGVSTDVNNLTFAVLDRDETPQSRAYLEEMRGSTYFVEQPPLADYADLEHRLRAGSIKAAIEIPPNFGRNLERGDPVDVSAWIDGAMPFRAETILGYLQGMHALYLADPAIRTTTAAKPPAADVELRFKYNQDFDSIFAMVPATMGMMLGLFPAILMALGVVREKELGSIVNLYVTPVKRLEFLLGKQAPYVAVALVNFSILFAMSQFVFAVPLKGSFPSLLVGVGLYVTSMTAYGMLISAFTRTQIAALFGTSILTVIPATQFSGMMTPVSSLAGTAQWIGRAFPMSYFMPVSVGAFTKGLYFADLAPNLLALAAFVPILTVVNMLLLRKQER